MPTSQNSTDSQGLDSEHRSEIEISANMEIPKQESILMTIADLKEAASKKMSQMVQGMHHQKTCSIQEVLLMPLRLLQWRLYGYDNVRAMI